MSICYWSRSLNEEECAYDTTHNECVMQLLVVLLLAPYVEGSLFKIGIDHDEWHKMSLPDASCKTLALDFAPI